MNKMFSYCALLAAAGILLLSSCKKDNNNSTTPTTYKCITCVTAPDALPANDGSGKGIYKGVIIGSSGTIKLSVLNGTNDIAATMVIDGTTVLLSSAITWVDGQSYVAPFTGTMNGEPVSITFSVQANGSTPVITSANIPGHTNAIFTLVKETSNALVEAFEGTYSTTKPETGTFNILLSRPLNKWGGNARKDGTNEQSDVNGTLVNGELRDEDGKKMGTLTNDNISGSFQDNNGATVTIDGKRTL